MSEKPDNSSAIIGESIIVVGDVSGKEDILINGTVEGDLNFRENDIFVGKTGHVNANVTAKIIIVEGDVRGELRANEQVKIKPSGKVTGDIRAPRVELDDGCQFKGSVDMEDLPGSADNRSGKLKLARDPVKTVRKTGK